MTFILILEITDPSKTSSEDKNWYHSLPCFAKKEKSEDTESQEVYYEDHQSRLKYLSQTNFWR